MADWYLRAVTLFDRVVGRRLRFRSSTTLRTPLICFLLSFVGAVNAQTARFEVSSLYGPYPPLYNSGPIYTTTSEAASALLAYVSSRQPWGSAFEPWFMLDWYGQSVVTYRVPHYGPDGYYNKPYTDHLPPSATPTAACNVFATEMGAALINVRYESFTGYYGGGQGRWICDLYWAVPPWGGPPYSYSDYLTPYCASPFVQTPNDDYGGEWVCGGAWKAWIYYSDLSAERPDECPAEGNPILPSSSQKVEYETDYDNGRLLHFKRYYGSQRFGMGASAALTHSFSSHFPSGGAGLNRRFDGTILKMFRTAVPNRWQSSYADTPHTIISSGSYPNETFNIISFQEPMAEQFDSSLRLVSRSYPNGTVLRVTYANGAGGYLPGAPICVLPSGVSPSPQVAPIGALQCVTDPFGRQLNFFADAKGRITRLIDPAGGVFDYQYDEASSFVAPGMRPANNLTSVSFPDGYVRRYHYNEPAYTAGINLSKSLTGISELTPPATSFARFANFGYDAQGRATLTERAGAAMRHIVAYNGTGQAIVTDPISTVRTHDFTTVLGARRRLSTQQPAGSGSSACSDTLTYDAQANVTSLTNFQGNKVCYAYDTTRRLEVKRVEGLSASADCVTALNNPPAGSRVITTEWHPHWRLQTRVAEPKLITTMAHNDNGATCAPPNALVDSRRIAVVCSRSEQPTTDNSGAQGFFATATGAARTSSYTYTTFGRVLTATDPNNRTTTYAYHSDNDPNIGRRGNVASITNAVNHVFSITDYNAHGKPTRLIDPNGIVTVLNYDARLRVTGHTRGNESTTFGFDPRNLLKNVTLPDGFKLTYSYDAAHRLTTVVDHKGNRIEYTLDAMGNRITEKVKDPGGVLAKNVARAIDALNRIRQVTGAMQ